MAVGLTSRIPELIALLGPQAKSAIKDSADDIAERAKSRAPVLTGALKESIHVEEVPEGYAIVADAADEHGYLYAIAVEFGGHRGSHSVGPHAFLYPAFEEVRPDLPDTIASRIRGGE